MNESQQKIQTLGGGSSTFGGSVSTGDFEFLFNEFCIVQSKPNCDWLIYNQQIISANQLKDYIFSY